MTRDKIHEKKHESLEQITNDHKAIINYATRPHKTYEFPDTTYGKIRTLLTYLKLFRQNINLHKIPVKGGDSDTKFVIGLNKGAGFAMLDYVYSVAQADSVERKTKIVEALLGPEQLKNADHGDLSIDHSIYLKTLERTYVNFIERQLHLKKYKN